MLSTILRTRALDRRLKYLTVGFTAGALALLVALRALDLAQRRTRTLAEGAAATANHAHVISEHLRSTFAAADAVIRQIRAFSNELGGPNGNPARWNAVLNASRTRLNGLGSISILDRDGVIRISTYAPLVGEHRENTPLFQHLAELKKNWLLTDAAYESSSSPGLMLLPLARPLETPKGEFDGLIWVTFSPQRLASFFRTIDLGQNGGICVFHPTGQVLFVSKTASFATGNWTNAVWQVARAAVREYPTQITTSVSGSVQLLGVQKIPQPGLIVVTAMDRGELLDEWWREVWISVAMAVVAAAVLWFGLAYLFRQFDARTAAELALAESRRLESLGRLTGGVAHDFNNLLTVITLNASLLRLRDHSPEIVQMEQAARRASELTRQLLTFARKQSLQPATSDLNELLRGIQPMLARVLGEDITIRLNPAIEPCLCKLDTAGAENAILNLCVNARDAMTGGGTLSLETSQVTVDAAQAKSHAGPSPGAYVLLTVADTGTGIPAEHLPHVFEPFFTTKEMGKGTGLGLSSVYGFVRQSDGHIAIESTPAKGTIVKVYFPRAGEPSASPAPRIEPPSRHGQGRSILLVEDEPSVREVAAITLRKIGYDVHPAADGPEALSVAQRGMKLDILLTDVVLRGGMNGQQIADEIRRIQPRVRVVFASGYSDRVLHDRAQLPVGARFIHKPYDAQRLAAAMDDAALS